MKAVLFIKVLRWGATFLFYFLGLVALVLLFFFVVEIASSFNNTPEAMAKQMGFRMLGTGVNEITAIAVPGNGYVINPVSNEYIVTPQPGTALNLYALIVRLVFISLGMMVLWKFMNIFKVIQSPRPFKTNLIRLIKQLALIFFVTELVNLIHYLLFNLLVRPYQPELKLQLITDLGNNFITGLIILAIAFVVERAVELQAENELTV